MTINKKNVKKTIRIIKIDKFKLAVRLTVPPMIKTLHERTATLNLNGRPAILTIAVFPCGRLSLIVTSSCRTKTQEEEDGTERGAELAILELWEDRVGEPRGLRRNALVYAEMAADLAELGYTHNARDVQVKLQNFSQRYRKEKAEMGPSGGSPSTWVHYERVHQIIGGFKSNLHTELTLESIDDSSKASSSIAPVPSPGTPLPSPSSPLPSPVPSTSASAGKARKFNFQ
ncbi:uncharacterized protein LOC118756061 [Rhagoletis pomonella]|uniref:uncharacterized protein LOC118756061 n=1 Tax=Rhagoletis pomonella TaxID=28610 RepID=UPI00178109DC|nr:uncharacterized protein LOC118756061 [Rhagoletis pomonella]